MSHINLKGLSLKTTDFIVSNDGVFIDKNLTGRKPGMLLIFAHWCSFCHRFASTFNELADQLKHNFPLASIESEELKNNDNLIKALDFQGFPTIFFFDQNGKIIGDYQSGDRSKGKILQYICKVYHHCIM